MSASVQVRVMLDNRLHHFTSVEAAADFLAGRHRAPMPAAAAFACPPPASTCSQPAPRLSPRLRWALEHFASGEPVATIDIPLNACTSVAARSEAVARLRDENYVEHVGRAYKGGVQTLVHRITSAGRAALATGVDRLSFSARRGNGRIRAGVLRTLLTSPTATSLEMASEAEANREVVNTELREMLQLGLVEIIRVTNRGERHYHLTPAGHAEAARLNITPEPLK